MRATPAPSCTTAVPFRHQQAGAGLVEVLVAIVVLAIGLLGLAGLQITSLQSNYSAQLRSHATLLAIDLAENMRSARGASLSGRFDDNSAHAAREEWNQRVVGLLGNGARGEVVRNDHDVTITLYWNDTRGAIERDDSSPPELTEFAYRTEL